MGAKLTDELAEVLAEPLFDGYREVRDGFWHRFVPRPDQPEKFDEQASFVNCTAPVSFFIGGNASGTTEAAAYKTAKFVLERQAPPHRDTPFWIISHSYSQVCDTCWKEKLAGNGHIPECEVEWDRVSWIDTRQDWPSAVPLRPWPDRPGKNWVLQFKSYEQGRRAMQARSIGGFWFSEQFAWPIFVEVLRGCRDTMYPGGQFAEFTPVEPELCLQIEKLQEKPPRGWKFYRANTECNVANLAEGWFEQFFATVSDEQRDPRMTGALASFEGVIYPSFNAAVHCVDDDVITFPDSCFHFRGVDWGASEEHPFACVWAYRDGMGDWFVYDEYWCKDQGRITADHVKEINGRWPWPEDNPFYGPTYADPSRPGEINEFNLRGIVTHPASNDVHQGIDTIRRLLKVNPFSLRPRLFIHKRRCRHLIDELRKYRWLKGRKPAAGHFLNPKVARPVPLKRDDDLCDSTRYCIHSAERLYGLSPGSTDYRSYEDRHGSVLLKRISEAMGEGRHGILLQRG